MMKDENEPVLFVNSCYVYRKEEKTKNKTKLHRLDDINVLLNMGKIVEIELILQTINLTGIVKELRSSEIIIEINNKDTIINLENVISMKIISTK